MLIKATTNIQLMVMVSITGKTNFIKYVEGNIGY